MVLRFFPVMIAVLLLCGSLRGQGPEDRINTANYDIRVHLDTASRILLGQQTLVWHNPSSDTIREMPFHLYLNAFKNNQSTFFREWGKAPGWVENLQEEYGETFWGWTRIDSLAGPDGTNLVDSLEFISPDDGNPFDRTVVRLKLPQPVLPLDSIRLDLVFTAKLPRLIIRTGFSGQFYNVVQWFPKVGVYEPAGMRYSKEGQWNCHQFHANTEFYADFGRYDVRITLPTGFELGATGSLVEKVDHPQGSTTYRYQADRVIDFAWSCSPDFRVRTERWEAVSIRLLYQPEHEPIADRYLSVARQTLAFLRDYLGEYPYPTLTIMEPPVYGLWAGAMEYPTYITVAGLAGIPDGIRFSETLTVHELCHQYFMQLVATNEMEEPWLDEGLTTFLEGKIMDSLYGEKSASMDWAGIRIGNSEWNRSEFFRMENPAAAAPATTGYIIPRDVFGPIVYNKTGLGLETLENLVGEKIMQEILQTWFRRYRYRHPSGEDFRTLALEVLNRYPDLPLYEEWDKFFDQVFYGTDLCDYAITGIENILKADPAGLFDGPKNLPEKGVYRSEVILQRLGGLILPQEVWVRFSDDTEQVIKWEGKDRWKKLVFHGNRKVVSARIDPAFKITLDHNYINNGYQLESTSDAWTRTRMSLLFWVQQILQGLNLLF